MDGTLKPVFGLPLRHFSLPLRHLPPKVVEFLQVERLLSKMAARAARQTVHHKNFIATVAALLIDLIDRSRRPSRKAH